MISPLSIAVLVIVVATLGLMMTRPGGFAEGWYAAVGAAAMLVNGAVPIRDIPALTTETGNVLLFLAGMLLLTGIVERARLFDILDELCARGAHGQGRLLFVLLYLLGAIVTALLSLDVTVILLTPIVLSLTLRRGVDPVPFLFGCVFVANIASLALPVSNLTNLLLYDGLGLGFRDFVAAMWAPNLVAGGTTLLLLLWLFRCRIPARFAKPAPDLAAGQVVTPWTAVCGLMLAVTLAALGGGLGLGAVAFGTGRLAPRQALHDLSLPVFLFVISMTVVVGGFERAWLDDRAIEWPTSDPLGLALAVGGNAVGSNVVNNVPMALLSITVIERAPAGMRDLLAYGALVGANLGPALTTYGSLATILWLTMIRRAGVTVSVREYMRISVVVVPVALLATTATLYLALR